MVSFFIFIRSDPLFFFWRAHDAKPYNFFKSLKSHLNYEISNARYLYVVLQVWDIPLVQQFRIKMYPPHFFFFFPSCHFEYIHFWQFFIMSTKHLSQNYENFKLQQAHFFIHFLSHFLRKIFQKKNIFHQIFLGFCCSANQNMQLQEAHKWKFFLFFLKFFVKK